MNTPRRRWTRSAVLFVVASSACALPDAALRTLLPPPLPPSVRLVQDERTYRVRGRTVDAISRSLDENGPYWEGRRVLGLTRWALRWGWRSTMHEGSCRLVDVRVVVRAEVTLPEWQDRDTAGASLVLAWDRFEAALRGHELDHRDMAIEAGLEVGDTLEALRTSDCVEMADIAGEAVRNVILRYQRLNAAFERNTRAGATQGAVWPPGT